MSVKPSLPKGTRDLLPEAMQKREHILSVLKDVFRKYGFLPIETPAMENLSTLTGKYGEEGDRLIFKILESGDFFQKAKDNLDIALESSSITLLLDEFFDSVFKHVFLEGEKYDDLVKGIYILPSAHNLSTETLNHLTEWLFDYKDFILSLKGYFLKFFNEANEENEVIPFEIAKDRLGMDLQNLRDLIIKNATSYELYKYSSTQIQSKISAKALRYDLTVPFARFVVQNQNDLHFPFKRYQIQPVWRADRPQKGRFREFYQCDADAVGSDSLLMELEFIRMYDQVFKTLGVDVTIHMNNRKLLGGIAKRFNIGSRLQQFTIILDKLDKIGRKGIKTELEKYGFPPQLAGELFEILDASGNNQDRLDIVSRLVGETEEGAKGVEEVQFVLDNIAGLHLQNELVLDISLARGLDYYTGAIFEVKAKNVELGSIGGGGRYDDLTGIFGMKGLSGIGISFGLDRIQIVMEELGLFTDEQSSSTEVLFINFGDKEALFSLSVANELRDMGVKAEVYPDKAKMKKQLDFANKKNIPNVVMIGSQEMESGKFNMKDMLSGEQKEYSRIELLEHFATQNGKNYGRH